MDEPLLAAYRATDYRVRLSRGGTASIRIGQPLPIALQAWVGERPWGFITAWNPGSRLQPRASNRSAQRALLQCLRSLARGGIAAGIGVGANGWREPSLFAVGLGAASLDAIAHRFGQLGYVHGQGSGVAQLRLTDAAGAP